MKTKEEGNKLIVEFMGYKLAPCNNGQAWESPFPKAIDDIFHLHGKLYRENEIIGRFHSSWGWLLPVVDKIESCFGGDVLVEISDESCYISYHKFYEKYSIMENKINAVWCAVVEFIEWYNKQTSVKL